MRLCRPRLPRLKLARLRPRRPELRWPTPPESAALVLVAIAGGCVAVWAYTDAADAWMPNAGTGAFTIAITITAVDWIVRRENRRRHEGLLDGPLTHVASQFGRFADAVATDYATTHAATFKPLPTDPLELLDFWIAEQGAADPHVPPAPDGLTLREIGYDVAQQVEYHEQQLGDVMEPELRAAFRDFASSTRSADLAREQAAQLPELGLPPELAADLDPEGRSWRVFVARARELGSVLRGYWPAPVLSEVSRETIEWAEAERRQRLATDAEAPPVEGQPNPE